MVKINCIITDDEPIAQEIIEDYINMIPDLHLSAKCFDAISTLSELNKQSIDLLFLDIKMPGITGVDFLKSIKNPPLVIFTTAYPEYAIEGFELDVVDYLLKPISFERFFKAISKVLDKVNKKGEEENAAAEKDSKEYLFVKSNKQYIKMFYSDILFLESDRDYIKIVTSQDTFLILSTMKEIEEKIPIHSFFRTHHSYIVNESKVEVVDGNTLIISKHRIPISKKYKSLVMKRLMK